MRKKIGFLKQALFLCFSRIGIDARCHVGISKHILDQGHKYLLWA
jgi:hypothetical protein